MSFNDVAVSNIFLACIALVNLAILALIYQNSRKN
jgi:hypothetical protein